MSSFSSSSANKTHDDSACNSESQLPVTRDRWKNGTEFLMSCIALSVGLGNVWRFPFIALENGGGAFLIPYIIVLVLVGIGYGQVILTFLAASFYASLMALTLRYFILSFYAVLPWSYCREEWGPDCIDSKLKVDNSALEQAVNGTIMKTSAEHYFVKVILHETPNIDEGIGVPDLYLSLALAFSWIVTISIVIHGIKASGKAAYFLALFPYFVMLVLLVRAVTLPGALDGIIYFFRPQWNKLLDASVWYAAVTQVFFSLTICCGVIKMFSSFNSFDYNIKRDCIIVTTLDTFTSLLSGIIIFGILGNLAHETDTSDIKNVVKGGPGLAFISYPDAIAKFAFAPQVFSALFFLMMFILGVGTNVGIITSVISVTCETLPNIQRWRIVLAICILSYCFGLMFVTPGGQFMLNFIDFYGVTFVAFVLAIFEIITSGWIYGVKNICHDIKFMLNINTSLYYRLCWGIITPVFMTAILVYTLVDYQPMEYNDVKYPDYLYVIGWCLSAFGIAPLFVWPLIVLCRRPEDNFCDRVRYILQPTLNWGPIDHSTQQLYKKSLAEKDLNRPATATGTSCWYKVYDNIFN